MIVRQCMRTFKSWLQYRAETLGIPEESLRASMEKLKTGDFDNWKIENDVRIRLNFILDHCNPEEDMFCLSSMLCLISELGLKLSALIVMRIWMMNKSLGRWLSFI